MSDTISRQEAIQTALEFIVEYLGGAFDEHLQKMLIEKMNALPSAQPDVTEEAIKDYCRKRCLTILTNDYFHTLTSAQPEQRSAQPEQRWIPCSERLPKERTNPNTRDFEYVLCSTTFGDVRAYKFGAVYGWSEPHFWNGAGIMDEYILAWMPLPEQYKEDENG